MADKILAGEDIRGLFLIYDDSEQSALAILKLYCEVLRNKGYNLQVLNASRPDILPPSSCSTLWPPPVDKATPTVLILHGVELLLCLGKADLKQLFRDVLDWLSYDNVRQVVCVANRELTAADELQKLEYICSQRVELLSRKGDLFIVNTLWKKPKGKAILQKEEVRISYGVMASSSIITNWPAEMSLKPAASASNMLAGLTFNVNSSAEEKKDRDQLVLPYTEAGEISYTLDREDDFDEEDDPDDDLNI
ncbi:uncharacterized protein LOC111265712 [Varroa jacobsoni]|uniref:uncharacterized protein LOC111265712 n=1 Tax=Varroa jacobsoni TaxID=62625 RepID=UPI000BF41AF7|nr:uncharacterized protein LOC111265712 [Varroa jacobsoni]